MTATAIRVRFAPSPTGHVHIGNIRVAIYNWLFARHAGGKFLLRIEDTDQRRSTPQAIQTLLDVMQWLQLDYDEAPVYQSHNLKRHQEVAQQLLKSGRAYLQDKGNTGQGQAVVLKADQDVSYVDLVKGPLSKAAADMEDFVILRSNGTPVFHLANVVDDLDMGITHVIRGDDHVENTYKHILLLRALDAPMPTFAHLPMIVNAQGKPYSKRDGDAYVGDFRQKGYLPECLFNFLALCGWSPGDDREIMSRQEMVESFDLERVRPAAAQFDQRKLEWMNGQYIAALPLEELQRRLTPLIQEAGYELEKYPAQWRRAILELHRARIRTLPEFITKTRCFFCEQIEYDPKAVRKVLRKPGVAERLQALRQLFASIEKWQAAELRQALEHFCQQAQITKFLLVAQPLRVAITGTTASPPIDSTLELIGKERVLARLDQALDLIRT